MTLTWTAYYKTSLPRIPLLLSDMLSRRLCSNGPDIFDVEACIGSHGNVLTSCYLAMDNFSGRTILASSHHVMTTFYSSLLHTCTHKNIHKCTHICKHTRMQTHAHTPVSTVMSSLPLVGSGFPQWTFTFRWVPKLSLASGTTF
jgi:hypothetical protein